MEEKGVIGHKKRPLAPKDRSWDGPAQVRRANTQAALMAIHTWFDSDIEPDEDGDRPKSAFKLPHHLAGDGFATVWRGVSAAMAALNGARGGVDLPGKDRPGVYRHLAKHYREFDEDPPELKDMKAEGMTDYEILTLCGMQPEWVDVELACLELDVAVIEGEANAG